MSTKEKEAVLVNLLRSFAEACKVIDDDELRDLAYDTKGFCEQYLGDEELEEFLHEEHQIAIWQIRAEAGWDDSEENDSEVDSYESDDELSEADDLEDLYEYVLDL
jgi:hypothetical protein